MTGDVPAIYGTSATGTSYSPSTPLHLPIGVEQELRTEATPESSRQSFGRLKVDPSTCTTTDCPGSADEAASVMV
jgi:hypothetical protein